MTPAPVEFALSRGGSWRGLVIALPFVALGLIVLVRPDPDWRIRLGGLVLAIGAGWSAYAYANEALRPPKSVRLDAEGLHHRHPDPESRFTVTWPDLVAASVRDLDRERVVILLLRDAATLPLAAGAFRTGLSPAERARHVPEVLLLPRELGTTPEALRDAIERFCRAESGGVSREAGP